MEGKGLFTFTVNCVVVLDCNTGEGLFYSRRIGRSPQLADVYGDAASATSTKILGAGKVTGRLPGRVLDRRAGRGDRSRVRSGRAPRIEPATNYGVVRGNQDFHNGAASVGFIVTGVNRSLDATSAPYLHRSAYTGGVDARWRFRERFEVSGSLDLSRVAGDPAAIALTQRDPVHLYQRPDGPLTFDSTRTSLGGSNQEIRFAKVGGKRLRFETAYQRRSAGFEINDIGFLRQADQQEWTSWANLAFNQPNRIFQQLRWNFNNWEYWSAAGLPTERAFNTNVHIQFTNRWWLHTGGTIGQLGTTYCDRCARGGPAVRQDAYLSPWMTIEGDDRRPLVPSVSMNYTRGDQGRSETDRRLAHARPQGLQPVQHLAQRRVQSQPERPAVLRHLHRCRWHAALHLRAPRPEDAEPDLAAGLHLHAEHVTSALRLAVHLQGDVHRRARGGRGAGRRRTTPATGPTPTPRWPASRTGSTSSSSDPTWCSAGSIGRARRCSWSGARAGKGRLPSRAISRSAATSATCSAGGPTIRSW